MLYDVNRIYTCCINSQSRSFNLSLTNYPACSRTPKEFKRDGGGGGGGGRRSCSLSKAIKKIFRSV